MRLQCWCGNQDLKQFSDSYFQCEICGTLVSSQSWNVDIAKVDHDDRGFYGREYWFSHQENELGCENIEERTRLDLPERCLYWLRTLLKYRRPPGNVLELGCAHGGFVALMRWSGYDAAGLELSPWVVNYARSTFDIPMFQGPVEQQAIAPCSLDVIAMMDVLEHLPDPKSTIARCASLLKPDGLFLVQTPSFPESLSHSEMLAKGDAFLEQLKAEQHLYLFSPRSVKELFRRFEFVHLEFEPAIFAHYDMFFAAGRQPFTGEKDNRVESLVSSAGGRLVQSLLELDAQRRDLTEKLAAARADHDALLEGLAQRDHRLSEKATTEWELEEMRRHFAAAEADRAARLAVIENQAMALGETEAERNSLRMQLADLQRHFENAEADRAARLVVIENQAMALGETEAERNSLRMQLEDLGRHFDEAEADRSARLVIIQTQAAKLAHTEAGLFGLRAELEDARASLSDIQQRITLLESRFLVRAGKRLHLLK